MAQNITLMGASYSDVPSVLLPKTGGGTASFTDVTDTTAAAADVASGKYFYTAAGVLTQGTASGGGGGASNMVTGTFKGTTTNAAMDVDLSYSGSGYPIALGIYPKEGTYNPNTGTFYSLIQRYAVQTYFFAKNRIDASPDYSSDDSKNYASGACRYKSSASSATTYSVGALSSARVYRDRNASSSVADLVKFKSATKLSVFIAGTSYGFAANIEYTYLVLYSS